MKKRPQKTAGIYDRWLHTLGGGEQVAFAYAEVLRDLGFKTNILTHKKTDQKKAEVKMGIDLQGIEIIYLPNMSSQQLSQYSEKYDLFINTSYLDYFSNRSKNGFISVFFPGKILLSPFEFIKRSLLIPSFRSFFIYPSRYEGFKYDEYKQGKIYKWLNPESSILFKDQIDEIRLTFHLKTFNFSAVDCLEFYLEDKRITPYKKRLDHKNNNISYYLKLGKTKNKKLNISTKNIPDPDEIALIKLTIPHWRYFIYNLFKKYFPKWEMRLHGGPGVTKRSDLESYQNIITISKFSQHWIQRYWGLDSKILYPPVKTNKFKPSQKKKNHIIHIGRFFVTGHNKKQLDLIKAFNHMVNTQGIDDWELHLIGSVQEGERHHQYFEQCRFEAEGYPVFFHTDIGFDELRGRLSKAKIYWHATGLDENEERYPEFFEHFGITTVEAMSSGCVPIVINAAGQKEIVTAESGMVWDNREELVKKTADLIRQPRLINKLQKGAIKRSRDFSRKNFKKRFKEIIQG